MMKSGLAALALAACVAMPATAATPEFYANAGVSIFNGDDGDLTAITGRGGVFFNDYFGVEVEGSFGVDSVDEMGVSLELDNQMAGFVVGRYPIENFELLGRLGYGTAEYQGSVAGLGSASVDIDGYILGVGGQYFFTNNFGLRGEISTFESSDDDIEGSIDIFTISAVFRFGGSGE